MDGKRTLFTKCTMQANDHSVQLTEVSCVFLLLKYDRKQSLLFQQDRSMYLP